MLLILPISLTLVAGLITTAAPSSAAPLDSGKSDVLSIDVAKRSTGRSHYVPGTDEVDFGSVARHVKGVKNKYSKDEANRKANLGQSKRATTSLVPLTVMQSGSYWAGRVNFGGRSVLVDFDTGSSDTILDGDAYTPSSNATNTGKTFTNSYGTAADTDTFTGTIYQDTFSSGGLTLAKASIGRITTGGEIVEGSDGLVGLGYPALSSFGSSNLPLFDLLINNNQVTNKKFAFALSATTGSSLDLGGYDTSKYTGSITYVPVSRQAYWQIPATINGKSLSGVVDSGTTLILGPTSAVRTFFATLSGVTTLTQDGDLYGVYTCSSPPKVTFKFGSKSVALTSAATKYGTTSTGKCVLSIVGTDIGQDLWILGDPLFLSSYIAFSRSRNAVGFATRK